MFPKHQIVIITCIVSHLHNNTHNYGNALVCSSSYPTPMVLYQIHTFQQLIMRYKSSHLNLEMILYGDVETLFTKYVFDIANFCFPASVTKVLVVRKTPEKDDIS